MLKLKEGFILRSIGGEHMVIPSGEELDLNMMITLNDTGKFLWERLQSGTTREALLTDVLAEYEVAQDQAEAYIDGFIEKLEGHGFLA